MAPRTTPTNPDPAADDAELLEAIAEAEAELAAIRAQQAERPRPLTPNEVHLAEVRAQIAVANAHRIAEGGNHVDFYSPDFPIEDRIGVYRPELDGDPPAEHITFGDGAAYEVKNGVLTQLLEITPRQTQEEHEAEMATLRERALVSDALRAVGIDVPGGVAGMPVRRGPGS